MTFTNTEPDSRGPFHSKNIPFNWSVELSAGLFNEGQAIKRQQVPASHRNCQSLYLLYGQLSYK